MSAKHLTRKSEAYPAVSERTKAWALSGYEMVNLYRGILQSLPKTRCPVIEVIAAQPGDGVSTVVRILAEAAAEFANARVLVCDATVKHDSLRYFSVPVTSMPYLSNVLSGKIDLSHAIKRVPSAGFSLSLVAELGTESEVAVNIDRLGLVFAVLRQHFDLILIDAGATSQSVLGLALAKKADRVVLVVEAERTRIPVVASAKRAIEMSGGRLLGVVLNKRRFRIPRLFYRWL